MQGGRKSSIEQTTSVSHINLHTANMQYAEVGGHAKDLRMKNGATAGQQHSRNEATQSPLLPTNNTRYLLKLTGSAESSKPHVPNEGFWCERWRIGGHSGLGVSLPFLAGAHRAISAWLRHR